MLTWTPRAGQSGIIDGADSENRAAAQIQEIKDPSGHLPGGVREEYRWTLSINGTTVGRGTVHDLDTALSHAQDALSAIVATGAKIPVNIWALVSADLSARAATAGAQPATDLLRDTYNRLLESVADVRGLLLARDGK